MEARRIFLMAWGEHKAGIIARTVEGEVSDRVPATYLQEHDHVEVILDEASSTELTRHKSPWLVRSCNWNDALIKKAVVWLSKKLAKPILRLTDEDYSENGLSELVTNVDAAYDLNIKVFNQIQHSVTGWPGGKPNADDAHRPERARPYPKRVLVFSPHPDDDVFSMGGTLMRLTDQGHEVHVAYQTSGSNGVYDEEALRFADFVTRYHRAMGQSTDDTNEVFEEIRRHLEQRKPEDPEKEELRMIKSLIRAGEARAACRYVGVAQERVHFLNMPFYETGRIRKKPLGEADIQLVVSILQEVRPHQIYAAGDLLDPHGTHRMCLNAVQDALARLKDEEWLSECRIWLYRGTWQEWQIHEIEMAVPLSPGELNRKRNAIFKHQSQKDYPLYPGNDTREFWERSDEQVRSTAAAYDRLGMAEYEAIEGFVQWRLFEQ
jgi:glucosamine-6-phosphate deaminase